MLPGPPLTGHPVSAASPSAAAQAGGSRQRTRIVFMLRTIARILPHVEGVRASNRDTLQAVSEFHVEKGRADAVITLSDGTSVHGSFFVAGSSSTHHSPERGKDGLLG